MCGRFALAASSEELQEAFAVAAVSSAADTTLRPRYNVAPGQPVLAVRSGAGGTRELTAFSWGLVPAALAGGKHGPIINVRGETANVKRLFRDALLKRRCLIPASGFFEWRREGGRKQPYYIHPPGGGLWGLAGLWEEPRSSAHGGTCAILTMPARAELQAIHDRMPVIVPVGAYQSWLVGSHLVGGQDLLAAMSQGALAIDAVSKDVNDARLDRPSLIRPALAMELELPFGTV